jgi:hypothetical protein
MRIGFALVLASLVFVSARAAPAEPAPRSVSPKTAGSTSILVGAKVSGRLTGVRIKSVKLERRQGRSLVGSTLERTSMSGSDFCQSDTMDSVWCETPSGYEAVQVDWEYSYFNDWMGSWEVAEVRQELDRVEIQATRPSCSVTVVTGWGSGSMDCYLLNDLGALGLDPFEERVFKEEVVGIIDWLKEKFAEPPPIKVSACTVLVKLSDLAIDVTSLSGPTERRRAAGEIMVIYAKGGNYVNVKDDVVFEVEFRDGGTENYYWTTMNPTQPRSAGGLKRGDGVSKC